jgi:hypothetical protein
LDPNYWTEYQTSSAKLGSWVYFYKAAFSAAAIESKSYVDVGYKWHIDIYSIYYIIKWGWLSKATHSVWGS